MRFFLLVDTNGSTVNLEKTLYVVPCLQSLWERHLLSRRHNSRYQILKAKHSAKTKTDSLAISKGESLFLNRTPSQERDTVLQILMVRKDGTEFVENRKVASRWVTYRSASIWTCACTDIVVKWQLDLHTIPPNIIFHKPADILNWPHHPFPRTTPHTPIKTAMRHRCKRDSENGQRQVNCQTMSSDDPYQNVYPDVYPQVYPGVFPCRDDL